MQSCYNNGTTKLICNAPNITNVNISNYYGTRVQYKLLDGAASPNFRETDLTLTLQPDPVFTGIDTNSRTVSVNDNGQIDDITINVSIIIIVCHNCHYYIK